MIWMLSDGLGVMWLEIRVLTLEDAIVHKDALVKLLYEILVSNFQELLCTYAEKYYHDMRGFLQDGSAIVFGAFSDKKLVGIIWGYEISHFGQKRIHCTMIGVKNGYRGQDIGSQLLRELETVALSRGLNHIEVMVTSENEDALRYYNRNGFRVERVKMLKTIEQVLA